MTYEFEYLMHLMGAAARGTPAEMPRQKLSWRKLSLYAQEQTLSPMILDVMMAQPELGYPVAAVQEKAELATIKAMKECAKRMMVINLLEDMEKAGIHTVMVKGAVAAVNYANPEKRYSTDTDIWVELADEERACEFLRQRGFDVGVRWENGHHTTAKHEALGVVEVHIRLYDEIVEELWFGELDPETFIQEPHQRIKTAEGWCYTLGDTDHLIFMVLHMIKHFISAGMCLRMMMDVALHIKKRQDTLDMDRVWSVMRQLSFERMLSAVLWIAVRYCGFRPEDFPGIGPEEPEQMAMLLKDMETGGFLGGHDHEERSESAQEFNRLLLMKDRNKFQYWLYMFRSKHSLKLGTFFPGKRRMEREYPCLKKHPWLLPFLWPHRWIVRGFGLIFRKKLTGPMVYSEDEVSAKGKERVAMFRAFGMLDR